MEYIIIGKIINTHGIRGELKISPLTSDIGRFDELKKAYIGEKKIEVHLKSVKYHKGCAIIKFEEYDNINQVLQYKNEFLYVEGEDVVILPEGHYFIHDLIECKVEDMDGNYIGVLVDVIETLRDDVYVVKSKDEKEHLIPAVKEFIKSVDTESKIIIVDPIEGMIS